MTYFLPYAKQSITEEDVAAAANSLKGRLITRGENVAAFEKIVAEYCGAKYAVAFCNGTAALFGTYFAANLTSFDRVVSTPNTFIATVSPVLQKGIRPYLVDIDCESGNMDLSHIEEELHFHSARGRLIVVPVHFSGIAVPIKELYRKMSRYFESVIIEDAAHAIGSCYPSGEKVGSCAWSDMTLFSFHPAKTITTTEGGLVTTNDETLHHRLVLFRDNGIERKGAYLTKGEEAPGYYEVQAITGNYHFTEFQGALGISQMQRISSFIEKRRRLVKLYRHLLKDVPHLKMFTDRYDDHTAFHLFVVQIDFAKYKKNRPEVMNKLSEKGIGTQVHYIPLYRHPVWKSPGDNWEGCFSQMESYYAQALTLPLYYDLREEDVERVCKALLTILAE